jgi:hypothetical protein
VRILTQDFSGKRNYLSNDEGRQFALAASFYALGISWFIFAFWAKFVWVANPLLKVRCPGQRQYDCRNRQKSFRGVLLHINDDDLTGYRNQSNFEHNLDVQLMFV